MVDDVPSDAADTILTGGSSSAGGSGGLQNRRSQVRVLAAPLHNAGFVFGPAGNQWAVGGVIAYVLFFIAGLGFGYAAVGKWRWLPLAFPLVLGLFALFKYGPDASVIIRLVVALVITALGVLVGAAIDARGEQAGEHPGYA
jgi:hypothetical protein